MKLVTVVGWVACNILSAILPQRMKRTLFISAVLAVCIPSREERSHIAHCCNMAAHVVDDETALLAGPQVAAAYWCGTPLELIKDINDPQWVKNVINEWVGWAYRYRPEVMRSDLLLIRNLICSEQGKSDGAF